MNVLFDNCTSPVLASTLHGFIQHYDHAAYHIGSVVGLPDGRNSKDLEWIDFLRRSNDEWIFVSGDGRIVRNRAELTALRSAGLHGFVLAPAYQKTPLNQIASLLIWRWPEIVQITKLIQPPSVHEIPIKKTTRMRVLL